MKLAHLRKTISTLASGTLAMALLSLTSCSDSSSVFDEGDTPQGQAITFTCSLAGTSQTRAYNSTWSAGDAVTVVMLSSGTGTWAERFYDGSRYKTTNTSDAQVAGLNVYSSSYSPLYYPINKRMVNFKAIGNRFVSFSRKNSIFYIDCIANPQVIKVVDLLYADGTDAETGLPIDYNSLTTEPVALHFKHVMSKLTINVTRSEKTKVNLNASPSLNITGMPTNVAFDVSTGLLGALGSNNKTLHPVKLGTPTATLARWEVILPPHKGTSVLADGRKLNFSFDGKDYVLVLPKGREFESGVAYEYDLRVTAEEVEFIDARIVDWEADNYTPAGHTLSTISPEINLPNVGTGNALLVPLTATATITGVEADASTEADAQSATRPTWIKPLPNGFSGGNAELNIMVEPNSTGATRTAYVRVKTTAIHSGEGSLFGESAGESETLVLTINQAAAPTTSAPDGMSNCYIIHPGELETNVTFSTLRAYSSGTTLRVGGTYEGMFGVKVLWEDNPGLITKATVSGSGPTATIYVETAKAKSGNAVVKLYKATDTTETPIWSYHIWAPTTAITTLNGWLDRNLGATTNTMGVPSTLGFFYQWGRKDPFPGSASVTANTNPSWWTVKTNTGNTLKNSVQNPMTHITDLAGVSGETSWGGDNNGNYTGAKSVHDPCPVGYRVPDKTSWTDSGWSTVTNGWFNANYGGYYPMAGYRNSDAGVLADVNKRVYSLTNAQNGNGSDTMELVGGNFSLKNVIRATARSVRCIPE